MEGITQQECCALVGLTQSNNLTQSTLDTYSSWFIHTDLLPMHKTTHRKDIHMANLHYKSSF